MGSWFNQSLAQAEKIQDWLSPLRQSSLERLRHTPWPTSKTEDWKYTPLRVLDTLEFGPLLAEESSAEKLQPEKIEGFDCIEIVFLDGELQTNLVETSFPQGLQISSLSEENSSSVQDLFGQVKSPRHFFGLLNDSLVNQGIVIEVEKNTVIEKPIRISHFFNNSTESHVRVLVNVGDGAKVNVAEHFSGCVQSLTTNFAEFQIGQGAELEHGRFMFQGGESVSIGGCHFRLQAKAQLNSTVVGFGSDLSRLDVDIIYAGEQARAQMQGIYLLDGRELFDLHTNVEHCVPNCVTEETIRGIAAGEARAVFNGRIHIHQHAQKTLAELNNRNLLLSDRAEIYTKPELEIYADDVRCAHGATVAQIDEKALYYLKTRGIDSKRAQVMLNFAFINELIEAVSDLALADWLRDQLQDRFNTMND